MLLDICLVTLTSWLLYFLWRRWRYERSLSHIPGPPGLPVLRNSLQLDQATLHHTMTAWSKQYGPVYKVGLLNEYVIVVSGYDAISDCYLRKGTDTAGRGASFRLKHHFKGTAFSQTYPDEKWRCLRKALHKYMKQFGEGIARIEKAVAEVSREMLMEFNRAADDSSQFDPSDVIKNASLRVIVFIICGDHLGDNDDLFRALAEYEPFVWQIFIENSFDYLLLEAFPVLFHLPLRSSGVLRQADKLRDRVLEKLKERALNKDPEETLMGTMFQYTREHSTNTVERTVYLNEDDVLLSAANVLISSRISSSLSFLCLLNVLAHNKPIQDRLAEEIRTICPDPEDVTLAHRPRLPYTRATMLELLRYHSAVPLATPRLTTRATDILGTAIPSRVVLLFNLWGMHHDVEFWGDPHVFRPERFLDDQGQLLPPDDEKRKHLMPFAAGVRVCNGEQFALTRLFLWITNVFKRFEVLPAENNLPASAGARNFKNHFLNYIPDFKLLIQHRM